VTKRRAIREGPKEGRQKFCGGESTTREGRTKGGGSKKWTWGLRHGNGEGWGSRKESWPAVLVVVPEPTTGFEVLLYQGLLSRAVWRNIAIQAGKNERKEGRRMHVKGLWRKKVPGKKK